MNKINNNEQTKRNLIFITLIFILFSSNILAVEITAERQSDLLHLLKHDCGSCHGMTLKGGLGPSLLPANLSAKPVSALQHIIMEGVPETPMPPWKQILTQAEAKWLVMQLQQGIYDVDN